MQNLSQPLHLIKGIGRFEEESWFATEGVLSTPRVQQTAIEKDH